MEESQISILPPELAAEARYLRRDWESRNESRMDAAHSNTLSKFRMCIYIYTSKRLKLQNKTFFAH